MKKVLYQQVYDRIYRGVMTAVGEISDPNERGVDWSESASQCAESIINDLVKDNGPRMWEAKLNEGTEWEENYICYDHKREGAQVESRTKPKPMGLIPAEALDCIYELQAILWGDESGRFADRDKPWSADTLEEIVSVMSKYGFFWKDEPPRCKDCGERLPANTGETFCGDECEENYDLQYALIDAQELTP